MPHRQLTWRPSAPSWWETSEEVFRLPFPHHFAVTNLCLAQLLVKARHAAPAGLALTAIRTTAAKRSSPMARQLAARYRTRVVQQWASTESYPALTTPAGGCPEQSIGKPVAGVSVMIVDDGGLPMGAGEVGELIVDDGGRPVGAGEFGELRVRRPSIDAGLPGMIRSRRRGLPQMAGCARRPCLA